MDIQVYSDGKFRVGGEEFRCVLGKGGVVAAEEKIEGDHATPAGEFSLRKVLYRPDRISFLDTDLPTEEITERDGWCDEPTDSNYNRKVKLPYPSSAEKLWREDGLYDIIVVIGYNDEPVVAERGSAVFMHVAREGYEPTEGCVALAASDLLHILPLLGPGSKIHIHS